jgi:hypothetical protein
MRTSLCALLALRGATWVIKMRQVRPRQGFLIHSDASFTSGRPDQLQVDPYEPLAHIHEKSQTVDA